MGIDRSDVSWCRHCLVHPMLPYASAEEDLQQMHQGSVGSEYVYRQLTLESRPTVFRLDCEQEAIYVNPDSEDILSTTTRKGIPYAVITGDVHCSTGKPLESTTIPGVNGVIRRLSLAERYVSGSVRTWMECQRFLSATIECTNFVMRTPKGTDVAVERPLAAARLSLEALSDRYEPHRPPFVEILWEIAAMFRFIPGGRQQGLLLREEMLREGTTLTAVGAFQSDGNRLKISPPQGKPYVLSSQSFDEIRSQVENELLFYKITVALTTVVGISLLSHLVWRRYQLMHNASTLQMDLFEICVKNLSNG